MIFMGCGEPINTVSVCVCMYHHSCHSSRVELFFDHYGTWVLMNLGNNGTGKNGTGKNGTVKMAQVKNNIPGR